MSAASDHESGKSVVLPLLACTTLSDADHNALEKTTHCQSHLSLQLFFQLAAVVRVYPSSPKAVSSRLPSTYPKC
jgi:hypothetical protein